MLFLFLFSVSYAWTGKTKKELLQRAVLSYNH
jgi:hypothetical protein